MKMKEFKTKGTISVDVQVSSWNIANILETELKQFFDTDRFIDEKGDIKERDYRFNGTEFIRKATEEEIELYKAFRLVENYFKEMK